MLQALRNAQPRVAGSDPSSKQARRLAPTPSTSSLPAVEPSIAVYSHDSTEHVPAAVAPGGRVLQKCSQCRLDLPSSRFPLRMSTLTRYSICLSHTWYWSDKQAAIWTPQATLDLPTLDRDLRQRMQGTGNTDEAASPVWVIEGTYDAKPSIVEHIANICGWSYSLVKARKSRAVSAAPPPESWNYMFSPPKKVDALADLPVLRLTLIHNPTLGMWAVSLRTDTPTTPGVAWKREATKKIGGRRKQAKLKAEAEAAAILTGVVRVVEIKGKGKAKEKAKGKGKGKGVKRTHETDDEGGKDRAAPVVASLELDPSGDLPVHSPALPEAVASPPAARQVPASVPTPPPPPPISEPLSDATRSIMQVIEATLADPRPPAPKRRRSNSPLPPRPSKSRTPTRNPSKHHVPLNYIRPLPVSPALPAAFAPTAHYDPPLSLSYNQSPAKPPVNPSSQRDSSTTSSYAPLTLFQLLDSPFLSPPNLAAHARFEPSRLSRPPTTMHDPHYDAVAAADEADDDLNSSDLETVPSDDGIDDSDADGSEGSDEGEETEGDDGGFINDDEEDLTGWEGESEFASAEEESESEGEGEEGEEVSGDEDDDESGEGDTESESGDWLTGFVKGQLKGGFGDETEPRSDEVPSERGTPGDEVDELDSEGSEEGF